MYVPTRTLMRHNSTVSGMWTEPDITETEWESANGVFVPVKVVSTGVSYGNYRSVFTMKWDHVNEQLDSKLFTEEALSLKTGDSINLDQDGQLTIEKLIGVELPKAQIVQETPRPSFRRTALIVVNVVFVIGFLLFLLWRRPVSKQG